MKLLLLLGLASAASAAPMPPHDTYTPPSDEAGSWSFRPDPSLPNVLLLGDSVSIAYTPPVRALLEGRANVYRPMSPNSRGPENCGDTPMGLAGIDRWLAHRKWDVIHFNWGMWDLCYRDPASKLYGHRDKIHGKLSVPIAQYQRNLDLLVERMEKTGAKLIWATCTVVPPGEAGRFVGDEDRYDAAAALVMKRYHIPTDDLHAVAKTFSPSFSVAPDDVHYTREGSARLARAVADAILAALPAHT